MPADRPSLARLLRAAGPPRGSRAMRTPETMEPGMLVRIEHGNVPVEELSRATRDEVVLMIERPRFHPQTGARLTPDEVGYIGIHGPEHDLWEVHVVEAEKGYGPLLYDLALEYVYLLGDEGLVPDRSGVSPSASRVWELYEHRPDVVSSPLPPNYPLGGKYAARPHLNRSYAKQDAPFLRHLVTEGRVVGTWTPTSLLSARRAG